MVLMMQFSGDLQGPLDKEFTIVHIGSMNKDRNHKCSGRLRKWRSPLPALKEKLKIRLVGLLIFCPFICRKYNLQTFTEFVELFLMTKLLSAITIPNQSARRQQFSEFTHHHSKLYEYLGSGRPLLAVGQRHDSARVIEMTKGGVVQNMMMSGLKDRLLQTSNFIRRKLNGNAEGIQQFTRRHLASMRIKHNQIVRRES
jgi:hypothetical protein